MIKALLIQALLRQLLDKNTIARIERLIRAVASFDMSGEEKRDYVMHEITSMGTDVSTWALNLAIEMLVGKIKLEAGAAITRED